jgi:hypothetical protein
LILLVKNLTVSVFKFYRFGLSRAEIGVFKLNFIGCFGLNAIKKLFWFLGHFRLFLNGFWFMFWVSSSLAKAV